MNRRTFRACLGALVLAALLLSACEKESGGEVTVSTYLTLSTAILTPPAAGGTYSFTCTVNDPAEDGTVECVSSVGWITGVTVSASTVTLDVAENTGGQRVGDLNVSYTSPSAGFTVSETLVVRQDAVTTPSVTVSAASVTASIDGGTYSFTYEVTDPTPDGEISCTADSDWVTDIDCTDPGTVGFSVSPNTASRLRTAVITLSYDYSNGTVSETVAVVQDHLAPGDVNTVIGTYTASGRCLDSDSKGGTAVDKTWTVNVYMDEDLDGYDLYIDGICPYFEGAYAENDGQYFSARAYFEDNAIVVPAQCITTTYFTYRDADYYLGFIPCAYYTEYDSIDSDGETYVYGSFGGDTSGTPITFTNTEGETWESDFGVIAAGCTTSSYTSVSSAAFLDAVAPPITMTRLSATPAGLPAAKRAAALPDLIPID